MKQTAKRIRIMGFFSFSSSSKLRPTQPGMVLGILFAILNVVLTLANLQAALSSVSFPRSSDNHRLQQVPQEPEVGTMPLWSATNWTTPDNGTTTNDTNTSLDTTTAPTPTLVLHESSPSIVQPPASFPEFERHDGVVIATKLHGMHQLHLLEQSLCLLHHAYNNRVLYDIVVFTTEPLTPKAVESVQALVAPANVTIVVDNRGLQQEIAALSPVRRDKFLERCNVTTPHNLTWWSNCPGRIAYNWQAEFRAWHLWTHSALASYHTMLWMDTDGFCTKVWDRDPVAFFLQHNLTILLDNFPQGRAKGREVQRRIYDSFQQSLCRVRFDKKNGTLFSRLGTTLEDCPDARIPLIHGFFHITNLDFYRSPTVQNFAKTWIGDCFLCRDYDDQGGVTIPAAVLTPHLAWGMQSHNLSLQVFHNAAIDGKQRAKPSDFLKYWSEFGPTQFPEAYGKCPVTAGA